MIVGRRRRIYALLAATMFFADCGSMKGREMPGDSQSRVHGQSSSCEFFVIQGRITTLQGGIVTVKTPDGHPGGPGVHAQFVVAGPTFRVDISGARVLLPDGKQVDGAPLAVGDRVLMVLSGPASGPAPNGPGNVSQTYFASTIERIVDSDKIVTH